MPGLENLLEPRKYQLAIKTLLDESGVNNESIDIPLLSNPSKASWALQYKKLIEKHGAKPPSKVAVASWLVENGHAIPSNSGKRKLVRLHEDLLKALKLVEIN